MKFSTTRDIQGGQTSRRGRLGIFALVATFLFTLASCGTVGNSKLETRNSKAVVSAPADTADEGERDTPFKDALLRLVKIEGHYNRDYSKLCASATVAGVGPEVCLGFRLPQSMQSEPAEPETHHGQELQTPPTRNAD